MRTNQAIAEWENEGGALGVAKVPLVGTENQIAWAEQIRANVDAEFDRVAAALESVATRQTKLDWSRALVAIAILEEERHTVMARSDAGYFIKDWQEMHDQVRLLVMNDLRYQNALSNKVTTTESTVH